MVTSASCINNVVCITRYVLSKQLVPLDVEFMLADMLDATRLKYER